MYTKYLFPYNFKKVGWILLIIGIAGGLLLTFFEHDLPKLHLKVFAIYDSGFPFEDLKRNWFTLIDHDPWYEIISIMIVIGSIFVACSREKTEDEFISRLRLESLLWATYLNYGILLLSIIFIYGLCFLDVMVYDMFTILIIFAFRFKYVLYRASKASLKENLLTS